MTKQLTSFLIRGVTTACIWILILPDLNAQQLAYAARQVKKTNPVLKETKLKSALLSLQQHYGAEILFEDRIVDPVSILTEDIDFRKPLEKNLDKILGSTQLGYKKIRRNTYVISARPASAQEKKGNPLPAESESKSTAIPPPRPESAFGDVIVYEKAVSGTVTEASGSPLPGVNVIVKGTQTGTVTNADGFFSLTVPDESSLLIFSFVGYVSKEIRIERQSVVSVVLEIDEKALEEVVVVGFGTQKKVNLTGAVSTLKSEELANVPFTQASQALSGRVAGVTIQQTSGQPGKDQGTIRVRGQGTFSGAGNAPLVLVDGIASSINDVNPDDIANISVLKDASSSAIYGSRAANGVILIETKKGRSGGFDIDYNGYVGVQQATSLPKIMDSWIYAQIENEAAFNQGRAPVWTESEIEKFRTGSDPEKYPNVNHYENLMNSGSGLQTNHNLRFSGGTAQNNYNLSFGYLDQEGLIAKTFFERYNMRMNFNSQLTKKFNMGLIVSANRSNEGEPVSPGSQAQDAAINFIDYAMKIPTTIAGKRSDGTYGNLTGFTIEGWLDSNSFRKIKDTRVRGSLDLKYDLTESLSIQGLAGYTYNTRDNLTYKGTLQVDQAIFQGPAQLRNNISETSLLTMQMFTKYKLSLNSHQFNFLGGYSFEHEQNGFVEAFRDNFPNDGLYELNAGSTANMQSSGSGSEWIIQSLFGRANYNFRDRYLLEVNARYDGSSRFPAKNRYGFFPSASAGWIVSEEKFFTPDWIDFLKLRASWGALGNQNIGNYPYQQMFNLAVSAYPLGKGSEVLNPAAAVTIAPNTEITWETTTTSDLGAEITLLGGKLDFEADYFIKNTRDILYNVSTSYVLGLTSSEVNAGAVQNKGWDFRIQHRNNVRDFSYSVSANLSMVSNKVTRLAGLEQDIERGLFVGHPLEAIFGYEVDGLFIDQSDIDNYATQPYTAYPGEYRFKDLNNDGRVTPEHDRAIIGNRFPKYAYGANLSGRYKGFDLSIQLRGIAGANRMLISSHQGRALNLGSNVQEWMYLNRWTSENRNPNASYPRMTTHSEGVHTWVSTYWMRSAAFLRADNIQIGYAVPSAAAKKIGMKNLYVYTTGRNLFTISGYYAGWDPEGGLYPPTRVLLLGLNIKL